MRKLLLLLCAAALPLTASAQWVADGAFPSDTLKAGGGGIHGVAVNNAGQVYLQPFGTTATVATQFGDRPAQQLFVYDSDGTLDEAITFLTNEDGSPGDTLGGFTIRNGAGVPAWDTKSGRGMTTDIDGNIYVSQFDFIYKLDKDNNRVLAQNRLPVVRPLDSATAMSVADDGTVYVREVFAVGPILQYDSDLQLLGNAIDRTSNFSRTIFVSPDGNTILGLDYENPFAIRYTRDNEFAAFDSTGITLRGMRTEVAAIDRSTGNVWFGAGNNLSRPNQDPLATQTWRSNSIYAFTLKSLTQENPVPVDSLAWYECQYNGLDDVATDYDESNLCYNASGGLVAGRTRGLAFNPAGDKAYMVLFTQANAAASYTRVTTANEGRETTIGSLSQNRPNPFSGATTISFELERPANVSLRVYDTVGRQVGMVTEGERAAGPHTVSFDSSTLAAGVYVYTLNVEGAVQSRQMMVVR